MAVTISLAAVLTAHLVLAPGGDDTQATAPEATAPEGGTEPDGTEPDGTQTGGSAKPGGTEPSDGGFFDEAKTDEGVEPPPSDGTAPPMPEIEELPPREGGTPPMPEIEELPPRDGKGKAERRRLFDVDPPSPDREPAGSDGGSFFDPGKLEDTGPSGGAIQIRGYIAANFSTAMRTNTLVREADGTFQRLSPQPFFDVSSATLYVGAPIFSDIVYARMSLEFLAIPQQQIVPSRPDVIAQPNRQLYFESAAIEVNPFTWAKGAGRWLREGWKVSAGVFIVPFGLEDETHANPANWFVSRPRSMTSGRVYPGTWTDVGAMVKWKPTFGDAKPIRPIELDVGLVNGDPCTQTRFVDSLFQPTQGPLRCPRVRRDGEVSDPSALGDDEGPLPINVGFFGVAPDNNNNKGLFGRVQAFPLPSINVGGSIAWGKHPEEILPTGGQTTVDLRQGGSLRTGGHLEVNFEEMFESGFPLPHLRGEVVYGIDRAIDTVATADRRMLGGYAQVAQALFRRKKTRLPGLIVQYRFDHADPSLDTPGVVNGVALASDFSDTIHAGESTLQGHTVGLRFPVLPRFMMKAEYTILREDGGRTNQLYNDLFGLEIVADF
jgi:hypothetical protein